MNPLEKTTGQFNIKIKLISCDSKLNLLDCEILTINYLK